MNIQQIVDFAQVLTEAERYRPAAEKILKGEPDQTVYNHYSSPCGQFAAGVSVLRDEQGQAKTLRAGDRFVIPAGFKGTWEVLEPCRKIYVMFEQK
jgi:uncharacterized cupin superfamily protein